ncbi:MAG TPA: MFS transporter [Rhizomicrobium sp.]|jgi:MFS family permease
MNARFVHPWVTFTALSLLFFLVSAATFSSLGVVLPAMVSELHWNWTEAGLGYTLLGVACGLSSVAAAMCVRSWGVRGTLVGGTILLIGGFAALALAQSVWAYFLGTILLGVAFSLSSTVPGTHVLTALFKRQSTVIGAYFTIGALGSVAGPLLYVLIAPDHGWRTYWWVWVVASVTFGIFGVASIPDHLNRSTPDPAHPEPVGPAELVSGLKDWTVRTALATPQFYIIVGAYTMYLLINTTAHGFAVQHLVEHGIAANAAAGMLSLEALVGAGISVVGGIAGEKVSSKTLLIVSLVSLIAGMTGLALAHGYVLMLVYAVGVGIGFGLSFVASTMLLLQYFGRRPYLELYSVMCLLSTAAALGPAIGGWMHDTLGSFAGVFHLCSLAAFLMLIATIFMRPPGLVGRSADAPIGGAAPDKA